MKILLLPLLLILGAPQEPAATIKAFKAGKTKTLSTKGDPEFKGIELTVKYPASWIKESLPGSESRVNRKYGDVGVSLNINVVDAPRRLTAAEVEEHLSTKVQKTIMSEKAISDSVKAIKFMGEPASLAEFSLREYSFARWTRLSFIRSDKLIDVTMVVSGKAEHWNKVLKLAGEIRPLFDLMTKTIRVANKAD